MVSAEAAAIMNSGRHSRNGFLCRKGLEEAAKRRSESLELAGVVAKRYLDKVGSVSGLSRVELNEKNNGKKA